jgi:predicted nucleotidyltransferase
MDKERAVSKVREFLSISQDIIQYEKAYIFGSYADGSQTQDSDIDVGIFVRAIKEDYLLVLKKLYGRRRAIEPRIEPHIFIIGRDPSGFAGEVERKGMKI